MSSFAGCTQAVYRKTSRELKRLDSVTRSPVYIHFDECLEGAAVIRSHGSETVQRERAACLAKLDENQRMCFASGAAAQWLTFRLQVREENELRVLLQHFGSIEWPRCLVQRVFWVCGYL